MISPGKVAAGAAALEAYAEGQTWQAHFAPANAWSRGATDILNAAANAKDQSPLGRQVAAQRALYADITGAGYGAMMSSQQCHDAAAVCIAAANRVR